MLSVHAALELGVPTCSCAPSVQMCCHPPVPCPATEGSVFLLRCRQPPFWRGWAEGARPDVVRRCDSGTWHGAAQGLFSSQLRPSGQRGRAGKPPSGAVANTGPWQRWAVRCTRAACSSADGRPVLYLNSHCRRQVPARVLPGICLGSCRALAGSSRELAPMLESEPIIVCGNNASPGLM